MTSKEAGEGGGNAGDRSLTFIFPVLPMDQRLLSFLFSIPPSYCPFYQAFSYLGCFEVSCVPWNPETSFKFRGYCSGPGVDSGEPAVREGSDWKDLFGDAHDGTELFRCGNCGEMAGDTRCQGITGWGGGVGVTEHSTVIRGLGKRIRLVLCSED